MSEEKDWDVLNERVTAASVARGEIIEEWIVNALECLVTGDGLGDRDRDVLRRAMQRVAVKLILEGR